MHDSDYFFQAETKFWKRRPLAFALIGSAVAFVLSAAIYALIAIGIGSLVAEDLTETPEKDTVAALTTETPERRPELTDASTFNKPHKMRSQPFFSVEEKSGLPAKGEPSLPGTPGTEDRYHPPTSGMSTGVVAPAEPPVPPEIADFPLAMFPGSDFGNIKSFDELVAFAKYEADENMRLSSLSVIAMYRNGEAINALMEFTDDPSSEVRFESYQRLWDLAADGYDADEVVTPVLQQAMNHGDPRIADYAKWALRDLADRASGKFKLAPQPKPPDDAEFPAGTPPHLSDGSPPHPP